MIVHIFTAYRYHLVPEICKGFATIYKDDAVPFFVLYGNKELDKQLYLDYLSAIGFSDYVFCQSYWQLIKQLYYHRSDTLLFHAGHYSWHLSSLILRCRNVNWVCWGGGTTISHRWRSKIGGFLKSIMFKRFHSIVTLMEPERKQIIENFGVASHMVKTISYVSDYKDESDLDLICKDLAKRTNHESKKPVVFLGNSHYWINSYISMLKKLSQYAGKIKVQCMLNYEFVKGEKYEELIRLGHSVFGEDFKTNETFYSNIIDYIHYMNGCDIYVCAVEKQTGLGAISTCLKLGKKIYITGDNLDWVRLAYNPIVFSLDSINESLRFEEFVKPLSDIDKLNNYQNRINSKYINRGKWHKYLKAIDNVKSKQEK